MRTPVVVALALSFFLNFNALAEPTEADFKDQADFEKAIAATQAGTDVPKKLEAASRYFMDRKFAWGPLGEGASGTIDNDPLVRSDLFDCTTYVETVIALLHSTDWNTFKSSIMEIRYKESNPTFLTRNHFIEVDWLKNNDQYLKDITGDIIGVEGNVAATTIKKAGWYNKMTVKSVSRPDLNDEQKEALLVELRKEASAIPDEPVQMNYIRFVQFFNEIEDAYLERTEKENEIRASSQDKNEVTAKLAEYRKQWLEANKDKVNKALLDKIPSGVLVNYVHKEKKLEQKFGTNMLVTHQALLFRNEAGELIQRHAALNDKVLDIPFLEYINQYLSDSGTADKPWGVNIVAIQ